MLNDSLLSNNKNDHQTPMKEFNKWNEEFKFDLDACTTENNLGLDYIITENEDCLTHDWIALQYLLPEGKRLTVFMNPPYRVPEKLCKKDKDGKYNCNKNKCEKRGFHTDIYIPGQIDFIKKAREQSIFGALVVCLIPARTDTKIFHKYIWDKDKGEHGEFRPGANVRFLKGRLKFVGSDNGSPFPSMLVIFDFKNL